MPSCTEMKNGQIYVCQDCGLELQVVKECTECGTEEGECSGETCDISCCDKPLKLKE